MGETPIQDVEFCANNNISISVSNYEYLMELAIVLHSKLKVHLKVNTGLNRYGFSNMREFTKSVRYIEKSKLMSFEGVFTHFATKKDDIEYIRQQKEIFDNYCSTLPKEVIKHCANSFATIYDNSFHMDMVRVGLNMYGDIRGEKFPLRDVLTIKSEIVSVNNVKRYQTIGYDRSYVAKKNMRVAIVPLGYADGVDRRVSNQFYVLVNGEKAPIVGNVCMDSFMIDVSNIKNVNIGTEVVLLGRSGSNKLSVLDWARNINASVYDILLNFRYSRFEYIVESKKENF